ncbi:MAG: hypothetical protein AAF639_36005 [Chloroflexota bacterium]
MNEKITYASLESFLTKELHFQAHHVEGVYTAFTLEDSDLLIILNPWFKILEQRHLMYVRRMLDEHGIMESYLFDEKMRTLHTNNGHHDLSSHDVFYTNGKSIQPAPIVHKGTVLRHSPA